MTALLLLFQTHSLCIYKTRATNKTVSLTIRTHVRIGNRKYCIWKRQMERKWLSSSYIWCMVCRVPRVACKRYLWIESTITHKQAQWLFWLVDDCHCQFTWWHNYAENVKSVKTDTCLRSILVFKDLDYQFEYLTGSKGIHITGQHTKYARN